MKKILILFTSLLLVATCAVTNVKPIHAEEHKIGDITFQAWDKNNSLPNADGSYYLTQDVTLTDTWWTNKETNVDLNGHTVTSTGTNIRFARVGDTGQPTLKSITSIYDSVGTGKITGVSTSHVVFEIASTGTLNLYGGSIDGNASSNQYGVIWINGGVLNVDGGKISGNNETNSNDQGIVNNNGTLNIKSGEISNNNTSGKYIIYNNSSKTINISGGFIKNNSASSAIIRTNGTALVMTGGEISGNHNNSAYCGPIWIGAGRFDLSGGTISANYNSISNENGADGVYVAAGAVFNMSGGYVKDHVGTNKNPVISLNTGTPGGTLNLSGGEISGNTSNKNGIINIRGGSAKLNITGGSIVNNTAEGSCVLINASQSKPIEISGSTIIKDNNKNLPSAVYKTDNVDYSYITLKNLSSSAYLVFDYDTSWTDYKKVAYAGDADVANHVHTSNDCIISAVDAGFLQLRWIKVSSITLNKTSLSIENGNTFQLTATVSPDNAYKKNVTWSTANASIATVSDTGLVTAVGNSGSTTITATSQDGKGKTATCTVTIYEPVPTHDHENGDVYEIPWGNVEGEWTKLPTTAGSYYLTHDITVEAPQGLSKNISICMNGHSIINANASEDNTGDVRRIMRIGGGATVTFDNCQSGGVITHDQQSLKGNASNGIFVGDTGSKLVLKNVTLTQIKANYPLSIGAGNTLEINGATITGNDGLITVMNSGHVDFIDGEISNNHAANSGAAIRIAAGASCDMSGGLITGNISDGGAAGIYVCDTDGSKAAGVLNVSGGTITGNGSVERSTGGIGNCGTLTITGDVKVFDNYGKDESKHKNIFLEKGTAAFNSLGTEANLCVGFENGSPATIATDSEDNMVYVHLDNENYNMSYEPGEIVFIQNKVIKEDVEVNTDLNNDGTIQMNFAAKVKPELEVDYDTAYVEVNGVKTLLSDLKYTDNGDGSRTYETPAPVMNPRQMTDKISMVMYDESGNGISEPIEMTVQDYLGFLAKTEGDYKEFAKSMLNYGSYTQLYFGYNTSNLANSILDESDRSLEGISGNEEDAEERSGTTEGATIFGTSLNLTSTTEFNVYFTIDGNINEFSVTVDDNDGKLVASETQPGKYYVKISGVAAPNLGDVHTIVIKHNAEGNLTFKGSVLSYAYKVIDRYSETKVELSNCMKAMYKYSEEAGYLVEE